MRQRAVFRDASWMVTIANEGVCKEMRAVMCARAPDLRIVKKAV